MDIFFDQEFRTLIPPLTDEERAGLEASLIRDGNRVPITTWLETGLILDGHNRYDICTAHNIPLKPAEAISLPNRDAAIIWIIQNQFNRRNLTIYSRSLLAIKLEKTIAARAKARQVEAGGQYHKGSPKLTQKSAEPVRKETRDEVAKIAHVSHDTIEKVKVIEKAATPEQKAKLVNGTATVNQVYTQVRREAKKEEISKKVEWPQGKYRVIYADPPWQYGNNMPDDFVEQRDHYPTMPLQQICDLPVKDLAIENAVLFLWATSPILEDSFKVINSWGFKYKASFVWDKMSHVMGHYNSVRHEFLLIATKGSCQPDVNKLHDSVLSIERTEHSRKPEEFRKIINTIYPHGPRIELFARDKHDGWETYGFEAIS